MALATTTSFCAWSMPRRAQIALPELNPLLRTLVTCGSLRLSICIATGTLALEVSCARSEGIRHVGGGVLALWTSRQAGSFGAWKKAHFLSAGSGEWIASGASEQHSTYTLQFCLMSHMSVLLRAL